MTDNGLAQGVWGVLATPFDDSGELDLSGFEMQIGRLRTVGASGVVALGVFGEAHALSTQERRTCVEAVVAAAGTDMGVCIGIAERSTAPAVEQARMIAESARGNVDAVMVQVHSSDPDVVSRHLRAISSAADTGLVVQDHPAASGVHIAPGALAEAIAATPGVRAIKAEAPPTPPAIARLSPLVDAPVFGGLGGVNLLDELAAGSAGAMTGFSYPEGLVATVNAWFAEGFEAARSTWAPWLSMVNFEAQPGIALAIRKKALTERGLLSSGTVRPPAAPIPDVLIPLLADHLRLADRLVS